MFYETPAGELIEENYHTSLSCSKQLLSDIIFIRFSDKKLFTLATFKNSQTVSHLLQQRITTSEQNGVFVQSDGDRRPVKIGLQQCDIHRLGSQGG